jgi:hypothetical protein
VYFISSPMLPGMKKKRRWFSDDFDSEGFAR